MIEVLLHAESALSVGLLDQAEILYRQVVIADPRNAIAVVGLARVALERGDEPGALAQARRALAIDGENSAAQRMVQRLEEVLAYRGVAAPTTVAPMPVAPAGEGAPPGEGVPAGDPPTAEGAPAGDLRATDPRPAGDLSATDSRPATDLPTADPATTEPAATDLPAADADPAPPTTRSWIDRIVRRNG